MTCGPLRMRTAGDPVACITAAAPLRMRTAGDPVEFVTCEPSTVDTTLTYLALDADILTLDGAWLTAP